MEGVTEKIKVLLIDGRTEEVLIYKYLPFRKRQYILNNLTDGMKFKKGIEPEIEGNKAISIIDSLADAIWADKNVKLEDVEGESLTKVIIERFNTFLRSAGFKAEIQDNTGG